MRSRSICKKTLSWILTDMKKELIQNGLTGKTDHILTLQPVPEKMHQVLARCIGKLNLVEKSSVGSNDLIYQTVSYISANFKKKFSLEEMAKDLGVSKYVLSRLFSKTFHRNFNQYLNDARLNYACHRLENTSDSITNICLDSGFESQRTFNRVFKERYKISPSDYRSTCVKEMLS